MPHISYFISPIPIFSNSRDFTAIHSKSQAACYQNQVTLIVLTYGAGQWHDKAGSKSCWDFNPNGDSPHSHPYTILKWQVYIKADKIFIALPAKATFPKFSHCYLWIPRGYVQQSCCIKQRNTGMLAGEGPPGCQPAWPALGSRPVPAAGQVSPWLCLANAAEVDAASLSNCPLPCFLY